MATLTAQRTGTAATVAILAAIVGYFSVFSGHPFWGLFLELLAIVSGAVGMLFAASPRVGGGLLSLVAIVLGLIGLGMAVLGMVGVIVF